MERVPLEKKVLSENDRIAADLRGRFANDGTLVLNFISSPGSGKTLFLERTLEALPKDLRVAVLTGDIQTDNDARRLARVGFPVQQITTAGACHLDARMIERALSAWKGARFDLLLIENVGNLVCPTSYDLGEEAKIVLLSVTEGEDKPLKYPGAFFKSKVMVLNKVDLLPYVPFDMSLARGNAMRINPDLTVFETSCTTGAGLDRWMSWLKGRVTSHAEAVACPAMR
ncbi:MAG TPA: hydrogenase nickel incorporation protein HypB [Bryobacteraceae bacterium]|nr:hydrogenase nickel incorporation protein HypB [Bryobacteraceae bacterium]